MKTISQETLQERIHQHQLWLNDNGGKRLVLVNYDLSCSDLRGSNLRGSKLRGSKLRESDLRGSNLENTHVSRLQGHPWEITVYPESLAIGCERHTIEEWSHFPESRIEGMDEGALTWWREWKDTILSYAKKIQN